MPTFEETFGREYGPNISHSRWDTPYFNGQDIKPILRFVAWVDLMGAENHMIQSLQRSAIFIGKIHDAGLQAYSKFDNLSLHPITDGFFAVHEDFHQLRRFTERVMLSLAHLFSSENHHQHRFLPRAGIAYGPFVNDTEMQKGNNRFSDHPEYMRNVLVGCPLSWAYKAEGKAPPFGIYIDQSVTSHADQPVAWVLHRWWNSRMETETAWAREFGTIVLEHFEWLSQNAINTRFEPDKLERYRTGITEYFGLHDPI